ncbi:glycosyltransferase family 2 protein [Staphylococcus sp. 47.1]|uniref:glycosyltransferase family 2 protein n=1 Tax=Staphylococcus sp. 47.1 TaxID=1929484 RepID=UPI000946FD4C|nr:glycosyltransferase family 2 protein [Staphylococcus sp. 47.1]OLF31585.1 hypothetical protein BSZ11_09200 [Staphylococcus sp. 47.1]
MFSIIITAHNSEKHIENTLNSVLEAAKNIKREIIVVDDGSSDNTFGLLKKYDEIKLIYQNNHGVSSARNKALKYISKNSQFITFIDDSDWISNNFFSESIQFFKENKNIQVAVTPIIVKENQSERDHFLNYRFNSEKIIVNILEDYSYVHFHIGVAIFKTNLICNINNPFDENINFWEDAKLINNILLYVQEYGLIKNGLYYYNRDDDNSLAKSSWDNEARYNDHIEKNLMFLIHESIKIFGKVIDYVQYIVTIHYLQFLQTHNYKYINIKYIRNNPNFLRLSKEMISYVDKNIIDTLKVDKRYKYFLYQLKNANVKDEFNNITIYIHKFNLCKKILTFSFSEESYNVNNNSDVYIQNKKNKRTAVFLRKYEKDILHYLSNDFSRNIFEVKLHFWELFHENTFIIKDRRNQIKIEVISSSIFKRILKNINLYIERKIKSGR